MARRQTKNRTGIPRIEGIPVHDAWVTFACVKCNTRNFIHIGRELIATDDAFETGEWVCEACGFIHSRETDLPFDSWPRDICDSKRVAAGRFWRAFFRSATEGPESYWKQCNTCGRILPFNDFSRHQGWGPLERQMECRACKAAINAKLNPKRTRQQLHEASVRRRIADLLVEGENERIDESDLFQRFDSKCFKTGRTLKRTQRSTWAIDHILPSKYLYPLTVANAALLSREANENKRDRWPSEFYTNSELQRLANITGANLSLLSRPKPIINSKIDVDACVERFLKVREQSNLHKRIVQLKQLLGNYRLVNRLSTENRKLLGF
ncbi:MAG: hypothetical protein JW936_03845 [Sedimentisphaerales bacterium]|nr:hypothetical protein [Sedimentisphaerales bacterium]